MEVPHELTELGRHINLDIAGFGQYRDLIYEVHGAIATNTYTTKSVEYFAAYFNSRFHAVCLYQVGVMVDMPENAHGFLDTLSLATADDDATVTMWAMQALVYSQSTVKKDIEQAEEYFSLLTQAQPEPGTFARLVMRYWRWGELGMLVHQLRVYERVLSYRWQELEKQPNL